LQIPDLRLSTIYNSGDSIIISPLVSTASHGVVKAKTRPISTESILIRTLINPSMEAEIIEEANAKL
jgi:hypothetical protein